ncbi:MAG: NAD-dependent epimerase/dehydratase family protein [Armatimonadota bacterium]
MGKVLVTGASGFTGSHMAHRLLSEGQDVRILVRPGRNVSDLELAGAEVLAGDLIDGNDIRRAMRGVETVYHIAALFRKAGLPDSAYWSVNYEGTVRLLQAALEEGVKKFVHCSTTGVLGHIERPPAAEDAPYAPGDIYQVTKCEAEKAALEYAGRGLPVTVVRPGGIYGPGDLRWHKLFASIARRRFVMLGSGETCIHMVYVSDLIDAFRLAADSPNSTGEVYHACGERSVSLNELSATIAGTIGAPPPRLRVPFGPVRAAAGLCEDVCKALHIEPPIYRRRVDLFVKNRSFDITKAKRDLGYSPKVDLAEGVLRTAEWYKEMGLL